MEYDYINRFPKEYVYRTYWLLTKNPKTYEKVSRKIMLEEIFHHLSLRPLVLEGLVRSSSLALLIRMTKEKISVQTLTKEYYREKQELLSCFLLTYHKENQTFTVPQPIQSIVKNMSVSKRHQELDRIFDFIKGYLYVHGSVNRDQFASSFSALKPNDITLSLSESLILLSRLFLELSDFIHQSTADFEHPLYAKVEINQNYIPKTEFTWEMYSNVGKLGMDISNPILHHFYQRIEKLAQTIDFNRLFQAMFFHAQYQETVINQGIFKAFTFLEPNNERAMKLYISVMNELPRWKYKGDSISQVNQGNLYHDDMNSDKPFEYETFLDCPCGSGKDIGDCCENEEQLLKNQAILTTDEYQTFYSLYYNLLYMTNKMYHISPHDSSIDDFVERLSQTDFIEIAKRFFSSLSILEEYQKNHENELSAFEREILQGLRHSIHNRFVALRYQNQQLLLLDEERKAVFVLSGIVSALSLNIPADDLPQFVETRLIPLKKCIIYDVFIYRTAVILGSNIRKRLKQVERYCSIVRNFDDYVQLHEQANL